MTLPFENNTTKIVKKLSSRSLRAQKRRNLFTVLTIALSVCLMGTAAFLFSSSQERTRSQIGGQYQAGCVRMTRPEIARLAAAGRFEKYGYESDLGNARYLDSNLSIRFADPGLRELMKITPITGIYPQTDAEICLERAFLERYHLPAETGSRLSLDLGDGERGYTLSGVLERENSSRLYDVFVSEAAVDALREEAPFTLRFRLAGAELAYPEHLRADIAAFFEEMNIPEDNTFYSSNYFDMTDLYLGSDLPVYAVAALTALACSIVIYSIFYISVMGRLREYGRLKVLGATAGQLARIVRRERRLLTAQAIPLGLAAAALIVYLLIPGYWVWTDNLKYAVIITAITCFTVALCTRKPLKLACRVSAIEAVRTTAYSAQSGRAASRRLHRRLTPARLAAMNFTRSRRKAFITMLSLSLTGILLICASAYANSVDTREMARATLGDGGDYLLNFEGNIDYEDWVDFQRENTLDSALLSRLSQLPGVENITAYSSTAAFLPGVDDHDAFILAGLTREQMQNQFPPETIRSGFVDYDMLLENDGILIVRNSEELLQKLYGANLSAGDAVTVKTFDGMEKTFTIQGVVDKLQTGSFGFFILPEQALAPLYPDVENFTACFNIHASEDSSELQKSVFETVTDPRIMITPLNDLAALLDTSLSRTFRIFYGFLVFIFLFALLNLTNTLITNLLSRSQEYGIFQSAGMSGGQLSRMLSWECLFYTAGTMLVTLTLGTACSILLCRAFSRIGIFGTLTYRFPWRQLLIFGAALLTVQAVFSLAAVCYSKSRSLVERIKTME